MNWYELQAHDEFVRWVEKNTQWHHTFGVTCKPSLAIIGCLGVALLLHKDGKLSIRLLHPYCTHYK